MSKELEYIQRHINIVKQQIKGSKIKFIVTVTDAVAKYQYDYYENELQTLESIEQALQRLEAIDNANPSEALECLEKLSKLMPQYDNWIKYINTIKQALLKAQEPKQYLKWEDLEFKEDGQETLVLLNDKKYRIYYYKWYDECINLFTEDKISVIHIFEGCSPQDKQFFNDLHLERVEE